MSKFINDVLLKIYFNKLRALGAWLAGVMSWHSLYTTHTSKVTKKLYYFTVVDQSRRTLYTFCFWFYVTFYHAFLWTQIEIISWLLGGGP